MSIQFVALETDVVEGYRKGAMDANGQPAERHIAPQDGLPCRHCLKMINQGEVFHILAHRPFPEAQPYAEVGPIFIHADACVRGATTPEVPEFLASPHYIIRGYGANNRIVYGSGRVTPTAEITHVADDLLQRRDIAYLHVRSATNNCYHCRIERV